MKTESALEIFARRLELQWEDTIMANFKVIGVVKETGLIYFRTVSSSDF
jgi:hypothetical protein